MTIGVGCHIGDVCFNVLAYADDLVILAPSWAAMQQLLQESPAVADKPARRRRLRKVCTVYVRAVGLL